MKYVIFWQNIAQSVHHIGHEVHADHIVKTKHPRFWNAHGTAHQSIGMFDAEPLFKGLVHTHLQRKDPNAVAQKSWRVIARNHALAENFVIVARQALHHIGAGVCAADKLQKAHVAHRIKVMGDGKPLPEGQRHFRHQ